MLIRSGISADNRFVMVADLGLDRSRPSPDLMKASITLTILQPLR
jgi:hypothetical protein